MVTVAEQVIKGERTYKVGKISGNGSLGHELRHFDFIC